jgi:hypothetical protein
MRRARLKPPLPNTDGTLWITSYLTIERWSQHQRQNILISIPDFDVLASINKEANKFNNNLNHFILEEAKQEGRKRKLEEQQQEALSRDNNFVALTKFTGIAPSSGSLVKHNIYEVGAGLLEMVKAQEELEEQKRKRIISWKNDIDNKNSVRFQKTFAKYLNGTTLTRGDFLALITKTILSTDATNGKNIRELVLKWKGR